MSDSPIEKIVPIDGQRVPRFVINGALANGAWNGILYKDGLRHSGLGKEVLVDEQHPAYNQLWQNGQPHTGQHGQLHYVKGDRVHGAIPHTDGTVHQYDRGAHKGEFTGIYNKLLYDKGFAHTGYARANDGCLHRFEQGVSQGTFSGTHNGQLYVEGAIFSGPHEGICTKMGSVSVEPVRIELLMQVTDCGYCVL